VPLSSSGLLKPLLHSTITSLWVSNPNRRQTLVSRKPLREPQKKKIYEQNTDGFESEKQTVCTLSLALTKSFCGGLDIQRRRTCFFTSHHKEHLHQHTNSLHVKKRTPKSLLRFSSLAHKFQKSKNSAPPLFIVRTQPKETEKHKRERRQWRVCTMYANIETGINAVTRFTNEPPPLLASLLFVSPSVSKLCEYLSKGVKTGAGRGGGVYYRTSANTSTAGEENLQVAQATRQNTTRIQKGTRKDEDDDDDERVHRDTVRESERGRATATKCRVVVLRGCSKGAFRRPGSSVPTRAPVLPPGGERCETTPHWTKTICLPIEIPIP
jgi:hypothetical protein